MEVGEFNIENTDEKSWGNYFLHRILKVSPVKVIICDYICIVIVNL